MNQRGLKSIVEYTAVFTDGERVAAAGYNSCDTVLFKGFDRSSPIHLLPVPHPQLSILP
jgi:hypothetical protein